MIYMKKLNRKKILAGSALLVYLVLTGLICIHVGGPMLEFASEPEQFRLWVHAHGIRGKLAYAGMVLLQVLVAVIPGEPLEIAGGYAFGALEGTILCLAGAALGSILVFTLVRRFGTRMVEIFFSKESTRLLKFLKNSPRRRLLLIILFIVPGTPKDLLCYYAGLTDIGWRTWLVLCSLGRLPSIVTSTIGGNFLCSRDFWYALLIFGAAVLIGLCGAMVYRSICKAHQLK